jgi:hypothetical protein
MSATATQGGDEPDDAHDRGRIRAEACPRQRILPGLMKTPMVEHSAGCAELRRGDVEAMWRARDAQVPMGHMGDAWDVANAALFLASDESKYVTGIELSVDGGIHERSRARDARCSLMPALNSARSSSSSTW